MNNKIIDIEINIEIMFSRVYDVQLYYTLDESVDPHKQEIDLKTLPRRPSHADWVIFIAKLHC